jgi:hypothetical protein
LESLNEKTALEQKVKEEIVTSNNLKANLAEKIAGFDKQLDALKTTLVTERGEKRSLIEERDKAKTDFQQEQIAKRIAENKNAAPERLIKTLSSESQMRKHGVRTN